MNSALVLILLVLSNSLIAKKQASISKLKDDLSFQSASVIKLGAKIKSIENELGRMNESYIEKTKKLKDLDSKIINLKKNLSSSALDISISYKASKKILNQFLLDSIDQNNQDELLKEKIYLKVLQKKISKLDQAQKKSKNLLDLIHEYEEKLNNAKLNEEALYQLLVQFESDKKNLSQDYIESMENRNEIEEELELALARLKAKKKPLKKVARSNVRIDMSFENPLKKYISRKGSLKGVTYKYNEVSPITSSRKGQVVYAGELASYGKVIMIDHGDDIRSVILGDMNIKVKKGDFVSSNGILGYVNVDLGLSKSLYYEIRKKNKVQNTLSLLKMSKI